MIECLSNPVQCVLSTMLGLLTDVVNIPIKPLVGLVKVLLTTPANVQAFAGLWAVLTYVISIFYGLFILFAGVNFIVSGASVERRARAKEWLQNSLLMIVGVQASFLVYELTAWLSGALTDGVMSIVDTQFFLFTLDNFVNVSLELLLGIFYVSVLIVTSILLAINYFVMSIGIIFFPFGVFFYFIPPLRDLGKLIISKLAFVLFFPFFASLVVLGGSVLSVQWPTLKIVLMIATFLLIDVLMVVLALFAIARAVFGVLRTTSVRSVTMVSKHVLPPTQERSYPSYDPYREREHWHRMRRG